MVPCVHICISLNTNGITPILNTCITWCWYCLLSTNGYLVVLFWFWVFWVRKKKKQERQVGVKGRYNFLKILFFSTFMTVIDILFKLYSSHKLSKDLRYDFFLCWRESPKKYVKVGVGKMKTKKKLSFFQILANF